ncbi:MATE family efflux transporter [Saccharibacillus sp. CPCC 101409]|uniref:MATE family efflux transporter n=1 Tax=Saccharibacillus sp. CPCC 101409 TaxID=3058041 RepID=UPI0026729898|nr:MATE family efflux transporter [Saccharibacillus sp. CPCC 101409]MDO3413075.1 MATE family efflux transporter [Saccharibacillus sp. CPCC 101409]
MLSLVIPIAAQNLVSAMVISADVLMMGGVSQEAMSAVSLAGQITFVLTLFYMGLSTGSGILAAQYWGKQDLATIQRVLGVSGLFAFGISVLFFVCSFVFPEVLMGFLTDDPELIRFGVLFLRPLSFSYLFMGASQMYLTVMRSMEKASFSAWAASACLILNIALNALCIFVWFDCKPERAVAAVAIATVCARFVELLCCAAHSVFRGPIRFRLPLPDAAHLSLLKDFLRYTLPVQGNYIVWGGALTATAAIIGHVSADMVAANSIASVVKNLAIVFCGGIAGGGAVLIGKYLGNGDIEKAREAGTRILRYALLFGILAGLTILAIKPVVLASVRLDRDAARYLDGMLEICAYYCVAKSLNTTTIGGIFPAGGDAKFGFWCDAAVMWGIMLPLVYVCAFVWKVPPIPLYAAISLDEWIKLPAAAARYRQRRWLNNITRNFHEIQTDEG